MNFNIGQRIFIFVVSIFIGSSVFARSAPPYVELKELNRYFDLFGLKPGDALDDLKPKYMKLIKRFHPDIAIARGLPEAVQKSYHSKMAIINRANDYVREVYDGTRIVVDNGRPVDFFAKDATQGWQPKKTRSKTRYWKSPSFESFGLGFFG